MRPLIGCVAIVFAGPAVAADPPADRVRELFKSDDTTVTWGEPTPIDPAAELEIGDGGGHGGTLNWVRFRPLPDGVEVRSVALDEGREQYTSKWPPDRAPVKVTLARMTTDAYTALLRDLAAVNAATVRTVPKDGRSFSTANFWVYARFAVKGKPPIVLEWAGYPGSDVEAEYARPRAAVRLTTEAADKLAFKDHALTADERRWASEKFVRDWKVFEKSDDHWWVRERYLVMVGVVGDAAALPVLKAILSETPAAGKSRDASDGRCVYQVINAVTRLTGKDVRDKPVEEMDIEKTRVRVLATIGDAK